MSGLHGAVRPASGLSGGGSVSVCMAAWFDLCLCKCFEDVTPCPRVPCGAGRRTYASRMASWSCLCRLWWSAACWDSSYVPNISLNRSVFLYSSALFLSSLIKLIENPAACQETVLLMSLKWDHDGCLTSSELRLRTVHERNPCSLSTAWL